MKTIKLYFAVILTVLFSANISAQEVALKSDTVVVAGNCGMCKKRIEKAAIIAGAKTASWDTGTKLLAVSFDPSITNMDALVRKVAEAGHDTEKIKADDKAYNTLPACCKYDRTNISEHSKGMDHNGHSHN